MNNGALFLYLFQFKSFHPARGNRFVRSSHRQGKELIFFKTYTISSSTCKSSTTIRWVDPKPTPWYYLIQFGLSVKMFQACSSGDETLGSTSREIWTGASSGNSMVDFSLLSWAWVLVSSNDVSWLSSWWWWWSQWKAMRVLWSWKRKMLRYYPRDWISDVSRWCAKFHDVAFHGTCPLRDTTILRSMYFRSAWSIHHVWECENLERSWAMSATHVSDKFF